MGEKGGSDSECGWGLACGFVRFLVAGAREDYSVTLGDLRVNREGEE